MILMITLTYQVIHKAHMNKRRLRWRLTLPLFRRSVKTLTEFHTTLMLFIQNINWNDDDPITGNKVIVFMSALLVFFRVCRRVVGCGRPVDIKNITVKYRGGYVKVSTTCNGNHYMEVVLKNKQD